jgi:hypothetical protein
MRFTPSRARNTLRLPMEKIVTTSAITVWASPQCLTTNTATEATHNRAV